MLECAERRMSIGSTQSFASICRMRRSAEIGSVKMTRSSLVRRAYSTRSSTLPELRIAGDDVGRAGLVAVVEEADDADAALGLGIERLDHGFGRSAAADDGGAAVEPARARHRRYEKGQREPLENQGPGAEEVKAREPDAGEVAADLGEEHHRQRDEDDERPGGDDPQAEQEEGPERRHGIGAGGLEHEHRQRGKPDDGRRVGQVERHDLGQVDVVNEHAETGDDHELRQRGPRLRAPPASSSGGRRRRRRPRPSAYEACGAARGPARHP